jgi:hypothetical protein
MTTAVEGHHHQHQYWREGRPGLLLASIIIIVIIIIIITTATFLHATTTIIPSGTRSYLRGYVDGGDPVPARQLPARQMPVGREGPGPRGRGPARRRGGGGCGSKGVIRVRTTLEIRDGSLSHDRAAASQRESQW